MADIKINEIKPSGAELFVDPEGFMNELSDGELDSTKGGHVTNGCTVVASCMCEVKKIEVAA